MGRGVLGLGALAFVAACQTYGVECVNGTEERDGACVAVDAAVDLEDAPSDSATENEAGAVDSGHDVGFEDPCVECASLGRVCSMDGMSCVECVSNAQCVGNVTDGVCDTAREVCVGCLAESDCAGRVGLSHCDVSEQTCVPCNVDVDCTNPAGSRCDAHACLPCTTSTECARFAATPLCSTGTVPGCVACNANTDCPTTSASRCDAVSQSCGGCNADADCMHLGATPVCDEPTHTCVACTPDSEATTCGANSCNPATKTCTTTPRGSVTSCGTCVSDSDCGADSYCVAQTFMSSSIGAFCLPRAVTTVPYCARPFVMRQSVTSLSGAAVEVCGLAFSTCPALSDFRSRACVPAMNGAECGAAGVADGYCRRFAGDGTDRCTVLCGSDDDCFAGFSCVTNSGVRLCSL